MTQTVRKRAEEFYERFGLNVPILQAPMAGACPVPLAVTVANAGDMGGMGALLTEPAGIAAWSAAFRSGCGCDKGHGTFKHVMRPTESDPKRAGTAIVYWPGAP